MVYKILELFKGTGSVGKVARKMGMDTISLDFEEKYEPDILTDILNWDYKKWQRENKFIPDFIWASPPCNTYSPLAYPLKERHPQTAKPYSERAKIGTKILYKTLEIIHYFNKLNKNLLFVIENPHGMMRHEKEIKKLNESTTCYCLYGDNKRKLTDFFNNVPDGLKLKEVKPCPNPDIIIPVDKMKTIEERYSIPAKLIKAILDRLVEVEKTFYY
jgi:site-specific DNA-cytosine methylase